MSESGPNYTSVLLARLGVADADPITRGEAVAGWLAKNMPSASLSRSLRRAGYAELLGS